MATEHVHHLHHQAHAHHHHHHGRPSPPPPLAIGQAPVQPPPPQIAKNGQQQQHRGAGLTINIGQAKGSGAPPPLPPRPSPYGRVEEPMDLTELELEMPSPMEQFSVPPPLTPVAKLPQPDETPPNIIPPEMEEATENWRQYAASVCHGRRLTGPGMRISQEMDDWELEEEEQDEAEGDIFRSRRTTVTYRFPTANNQSIGSSSSSEEQQQRRKAVVARKLSMGHQRRSAEDPRSVELFKQALCNNIDERRLSFPERSLLSANYAILRKSVDRFEVVGAFHRCHSEAYRHFLQSLTCYDLAPQHGLIVMLDAELTIQKAVQVLCAHPAPRVAVISNTRDGHWAMFTVTDCLLALQKAHKQLDAQLGDNTLRHFLDNVQNGRRLISVDDQSSVWDLARVFVLNRVHRVPVFSADTSELIAILCPRAICQELLKLLASKCSLSPDLQTISLSSRFVGTWGAGEIATIEEGDSCARAIALFLDKQVSALPVLSSRDGSLLGVLDKNNLLDRLFERLGSHQSPERCFQLMEETLVEDLLPQARRRTVRADCSLADAMRVLTEDGLMESLFVVEPSGGEGQEEDEGVDRLCGVLSHTDLLAFILSCEQQQQMATGYG